MLEDEGDTVLAFREHQSSFSPLVVVQLLGLDCLGSRPGSITAAVCLFHGKQKEHNVHF